MIVFSGSLLFPKEVITATSNRPKRSAPAANDGSEKSANSNKKKKISKDTAIIASEEKCSKASDRSIYLFFYLLGEVAKEKTVKKNATVVTKDKEKKDSESSDNHAYWLMKAEPNSRIEKGVDVKFSIDDLEKAKSPEPWDGIFSMLLHIYKGKVI